MILNSHPRDIFKYCPKCGSNHFITNDLGHSFHCEACHFVYFINSSAAVACLIFNDAGKLLLTRRSIDPAKGMLDLPGGFVEPMERVEDALVREIREELGVMVTKADFLVSYPNEYIYSGFSVFTADLAFICSITDQAAMIPSDDVSGVEYLFPEEVMPETLCSKSMYNIIRYFISTNQ